MAPSRPDEPMEPFIQNLKDGLDHTLHHLASGYFFSFTEEERRRLENEGQSLRHRLETMETGFLTVGLIGGTGVGKSTLMNALAGEAIAGASDRRPHTDRILLYKHETVRPGSLAGLDGIPCQIVDHTSEAIRRIILCDLPDFDSIIEEHRQKVLGFLEHLDILVWVASIEKYADGRFYEFLKTVPKADQNYYFVLNKIDQCFEAETVAAGYEALNRVLKTFTEHIQKNGPDHPLLFPVSAKAAFEKATLQPWNQFRYLSREIFQQRDLKAVTAIKAVNLDAEIRQYLSSFQIEQQHLNAFDQILEVAAEEVSQRRSKWHESGQKTISDWIERNIAPALIRRQGDISCLIGPGYGIGLVFAAWSHRFDAARGSTSDLSADDLSREMAELFKQRIQWVTERLCHQCVYHVLPNPFEEKIRQAMAPEILCNDLIDRFRQVFSVYLSEPKDGSSLFVAGQRLAYGVVFLLFLLAIGGETVWRRAIDTPGWQSIFTLLVSMVHTLFSETGLAALASLILIHLFLGFRFFHRFRKRRKDAVQKIVAALGIAAGSAWQETLEAMIDRVDRLKTDTQDRLKDPVYRPRS